MYRVFAFASLRRNEASLKAVAPFLLEWLSTPGRQRNLAAVLIFQIEPGVAAMILSVPFFPSLRGAQRRSNPSIAWIAALACGLLAMTIFISAPAFAQCASPAGAESQTRYSANKLYYCGGGTWREVPGGSGSGTGAGCVVGSVYAPDGFTHTFFSASTHVNCASIGQARTCTNGVLSGSGTYSHPFCSTASSDCTTGPVGTVCASDGAYYIGDIGGARIYARSTDSTVSGLWKNTMTDTPGTNSATDGTANTDAMIPDGNHPIATLCRGHGAEWYVPAKDEFNLLWDNSTSDGGPLDLAAMGFEVSDLTYYRTSTQYSAMGAWVQRLSDGTQAGNGTKIAGYRTRCVRRQAICGGVWVGGYCWYLGASNQSCDTVCVTHGGCNLSGTRDYVGSGGTNGNCQAVLIALGQSAPTIAGSSSSLGCFKMIGNSYRGTISTTCEADSVGTSRYRACACNG